MPPWILILYFLCGFLVVFGAVAALWRPSGQVQVRLSEALGGAQVARRASRPATARARSALFRLFRMVLSELIKPLPVRTKNPRIIQRLAWAGFLGQEAPRLFLGARLFLGGGLFLLYNLLALASPAERGRTFLFAVVLGLVGFLLPNFWLKRRIRRRQDAIRRSVPDGIDLLIICVEAGQGLDQAMKRVGEEMQRSDPVFSRELQIMNFELRTGKSRAEALRNLYARSGVEDLKSFAAMLIHADRYGVSMGDSLRIFSETLRTKRRQAAEEAAAKTTIKIAFPLVLFIFPALMTIVLAPAIITLMTGFLGQ